MKKIKVITDSIADLSFEFKAKNPEIDIIPLPILYHEKDISSLPEEEFYDILKNGDVVPTTSQINPETYMEYFRKYKDYDILYICVASKLSGTYSSAMLALQMMQEEGEEVDVTVYDTEAISIGEGLFVEQAYELMQEGIQIPEIIERLEDTKKRMIFRAVVDDIEYVFKGGRLSKTSWIIGSMLNIKPILSINNNKCVPVNKVRGLKKANSAFLDEMKKHEIHTLYVGTTIDCDEYNFLKKDIQIPYKEFHVGKSVSVHSGPLCYGVIYITK